MPDRPERVTINYIDVAGAIVADEMPGQDPALLKLYTLLALTEGVNTTLQHVHDAWSLWRSATRPDHPSIVPFEALSHDVQELDRPYMDAIHRATARILRAWAEPTEGQQAGRPTDEEIHAAAGDAMSALSRAWREGRQVGPETGR